MKQLCTKNFLIYTILFVENIFFYYIYKTKFQMILFLDLNVIGINSMFSDKKKYISEESMIIAFYITYYHREWYVKKCTYSSERKWIFEENNMTS